MSIVEKVSLSQSDSFFSSSRSVYFLSIIPVIILTYIQLVYNLLLVSFVANTLFKFTYIIEHDIEKYIDKKAHMMFVEIVECNQKFIANGCSHQFIPPALQEMCKSWDICMQQDTKYVIHSKETAEIFAQILNNFFEHLSAKTIYCISATIIGIVIALNLVLHWSRKVACN